MDHSKQQEANEPRDEQAQTVQYCSFHPGVETGLSCSKCDKHICTRCMVQAPVGIRCRECANVQKLPTFDVQPSYYMRASVAGGLTGFCSGLVWGIIIAILSYPALSWVLALGVGHLVGESVSIATNRKRGQGLIVVAGASLLIALITAGIIEIGVFRWMFGGLFGIMALVIALFAAINRVRVR